MIERSVGMLKYRAPTGGCRTDAEGEAVEQPTLKVSEVRLTKLANDLGDMQEYLGKQVERMDAIVDGIEAKWRGRPPRRTGTFTAPLPRTPYASG